ncbi:MAG: hypothetical protein H7A51_10780 [Akkermansiaceae bacterium]|nr:hypothetical protein [Akkermansiaceae bacterium]
MPTRRQFIQTTAATAAAYALPLRAQAQNGDSDTTFFIASDTHYSSVDENHPASHAMVNAINRIADGKTLWPETLGGKATGFSCAGQPVAPPRGIVHLGDMTDHGSPRELRGGRGFLGIKNYYGFRQFWEHDGPGKLKVKYPVHCGLGNHDLDFGNNNRETMWRYVTSRHQGKMAPVPVRDFDPDSLCYALHWGPLRILQLQRFATDTVYKRKSGLPWLKKQLAAAATAGQHVLLCQHYGFDPFGLQKRWWTERDRQQLLDATKPHPNIIGLCHGHSHATGLYKQDHLRILRCNNMGWELDAGNKDGHGSFAVVHASHGHFNLVHVDCTAADGSFRFRPENHFSAALT